MKLVLDNLSWQGSRDSPEYQGRKELANPKADILARETGKHIKLKRNRQIVDHFQHQSPTPKLDDHPDGVPELLYRRKEECPDRSDTGQKGEHWTT